MVAIRGPDDVAVNDAASAVIEAHRVEQRRDALRARAMARAPFEQIRALTEIAIIEGGLGERIVLFEAARSHAALPTATLSRIPPRLGWILDEGETPQARLDRLLAQVTRVPRLGELASELGILAADDGSDDDAWSRGARLAALLAASPWNAADELRAEEANDGGEAAAGGPPVPAEAIGVVLEIGELPFGQAAEAATAIADAVSSAHRTERRRRAEDVVAFFETQLRAAPGRLEPGFDEKRREAILRDRLEHARGLLERIRGGGGERVRVLRRPDEMVEG